MIELIWDLRVINVLAKFQNDPWKIMDVRVLTGLVCPAALLPTRPLGRGQHPGALKGCVVKIILNNVKVYHKILNTDNVSTNLNNTYCLFCLIHFYSIDVLLYQSSIKRHGTELDHMDHSVQRTTIFYSVSVSARHVQGIVWSSCDSLSGINFYLAYMLFCDSILSWYTVIF